MGMNVGRAVNVLFRDRSWFDLERGMDLTLRSEIQGLDAEKLLTADPAAMEKYFVDRFFLDMPELRKDNISVEQREVLIDISQRMDFGFGGHGSRTVTGMEYEAHVPFNGDPDLLKTCPTTQSSRVPQGTIKDRQNVIVYTVKDVQLQPQQVENAIDGFVSDVEQNLGWLKPSVVHWNNTLPGKVSTQVVARRDKLIQDRNAAGSLKYKLRDRAGTSRTYAAPEVKRKVLPTMPPASSAPWKPEPMLEMSIYEHILRVITDAATTWEHSPSAFNSMDEESLRTQILFQMNGHFEGQGTAETFNKDGKTDILIRSQGRNIFIGECKFWGGAKVLTDTIEQLLGYTSWRDTKVAVIIFNRNKNFSAVLDQIRPTTEAHPNCKRFLTKVSDSQFRFLFTQRDDPSREMTLTVMAFDVPQP